MNTILIVMATSAADTAIILAAVYGVPMGLAVGLLILEGIALKVKAFFQRRKVNRRLDRLAADYFTGEQE